jgi:hypothetical protein
LRHSCEYQTRNGEPAVSHTAAGTVSRPSQRFASHAMAGTMAMPARALGRRSTHSLVPPTAAAAATASACSGPCTSSMMSRHTIGPGTPASTRVNCSSIHRLWWPRRNKRRTAATMVAARIVRCRA